jgi:DNA-binding SARP family transcriptional activator/streptogramin lyase
MQIRILGSLEVSDDGRVVELGAGRQRALLALLALRPREIVGTDRLIDELWGSTAPATAPKALQNLVSQLRRSLGGAAIETVAPGYRLPLADEDLDARRFERLAAEGRRLLDDDPRRAAQTLREALGLWRGSALADFAYEDFAQHEIARLDELRLGAIEDRIEADLATGRAAELVSELETLVSANPLRERVRGQLMLALYRSGRQAEALETYREGRAVLQAELGLEPGAALRELEQAILNQDPALGPPPKLPRPAPTSRRRRAAIGAFVAAAVAIAVVVAAAIATRDDPAPVVVPNSLVKIDAETNEIVDVVPVGREPGEVSVVGKYVFVSSQADKTLTRVTSNTSEVRTSGASGADGGLAAAGDRFVWVTSLSRARVERVDADSMLIVDGVAIPRHLGLADVAVGRGSLWVSYTPSPAAVVRYDLPTLRPERRYAFGFYRAPIQIAYGLGAAWVSAGFGGLLRIGGASGETSEMRVGAGPSGLAVGVDSVWVAMVLDDNVWRIDPLSGTASSIVNVGDKPVGVAVGAGSVWATNHCDGTVSRIDPASNEVVATIETEYFPRWLDVGHGYVWVGVGREPLSFQGPFCN